jgi:bifunctional enzyme CysN/CysC
MAGPSPARPQMDASPSGATAAVHPAPASVLTGGTINILTCGSVDDGKSTLIGRLLWDASDLPDDTRDMVRRSARAKGDGDLLDFSLLCDGLIAEREQGITIDVAWRYLDTGNRRFVIIDSPGHEQYTRNMASGASHADIAVMLVDARHGVRRQTRRHAAILNLMGVTQVTLAVNKMDLVGWSEERFREIEADFRQAVAALGFTGSEAIPVAARLGDNVANRSANMPWYKGPTLVSLLASVPPRRPATAQGFRMPVQLVLRDAADFRGLAGTIGAGTVRPGDTVCDALSGRTAQVRTISTMDGDLAEASAGKSVVLQIGSTIDVTRGTVLSSPDLPPVLARQIDARLVWLADEPFDAGRRLLVRTAADLAPVASIGITARIDLDDLSVTPGATCGANDIADASLTLARPVAIDRFADYRDTGCFLLVDALSGATLAAGVVNEATPGDLASAEADLVLTRWMLAQGLCADLDSSPAGKAEFKRRAQEVASLLRAVGIAVKLDGI